MEEYLRPHTKEAIYYPEGKDHRHAIDEPASSGALASARVKEIEETLQTQEPRKGSNGELHVDFCEVVMYDRQTSVDE